jgi:hypothetical protein
VYLCSVQKDGILCEHVLRTLIQINKHSLPEKYFIQRWRHVDKDQVRNENTFIPFDLSSDNNTLKIQLTVKGMCCSIL